MMKTFFSIVKSYRSEIAEKAGKEKAYSFYQKRIGFYYLWSWRESNPRPNKDTQRFLHVYFVINCRLYAGHKQPTYRLVTLS
jgi:hypothetical protein